MCEIWNGDALVRVMGSPQIQQLLYFEEVPASVLEKIKLWQTEHKGTTSRYSDGSAETSLKFEVLVNEIKEKFHVFTLEEATELGLMSSKSNQPSRWERLRKWVTRTLNNLIGDKQKSADPQNDMRPNEGAPNISMNLSLLKKPWELYLAAVAGVLTQAAVFGVATYSAYSPGLQFNKAGLTIPSYSYRN